MKFGVLGFTSTLFVIAVATSSCSAVDSGKPGEDEASSTTSAPPSASTMASPSPSPSTPRPQSPSPTDTALREEPSDPPESSTLSTEKAGSKLSLADFFDPDGSWSENRFDVADRSGVSGIATQVGSYGQPQTLELRLQNNFKTLTFNVGQSNYSKSSDKILVVRVVGNGKQLDVQKVPFNTIQPISVQTKMVNALKIELSSEAPQGSDLKSLTAVISDVTVR